MTWLLLLAGMLLAVVGSAGAAALVTTARVELAEAIARRLRGAQESLGWLAHIERQVVAATAATSLGVALTGATIPGLVDGASPLGFALMIFLVAVPVTIVGGYLVPRWFAVPRAGVALEQLQRVLAGWATMVGVVLPARNPDPSDDVRALAREGTASGVGGDELVMVGGVMSFAARPVRAVMTPRTDVVALPHDAGYDDVEKVFAESGYTRIPVYGSTLDEIAGMIHAFDLFKYQPGGELPLRPVSFAPAFRSAGDVLLDMQREHQHFTVVVDEFGGTAGIVTLEDLLEALVGEIADEDDVPAAPQPPSGQLIEVDGSEAPSVIAEHFAVELPATDAASFGGMLAELAGRIPHAGQRFLVSGLEVDVLQASPTRVERVVVRRNVVQTIQLDRPAG
jgi:CBS domain containing-hemolysin-like protein